MSETVFHGIAVEIGVTKSISAKVKVDSTAEAIALLAIAAKAISEASKNTKRPVSPESVLEIAKEVLPKDVKKIKNDKKGE